MGFICSQHEGERKPIIFGTGLWYGAIGKSRGAFNLKVFAIVEMALLVEVIVD
jgi:hypothetical protein